MGGRPEISPPHWMCDSSQKMSAAGKSDEKRTRPMDILLAVPRGKGRFWDGEGHLLEAQFLEADRLWSGTARCKSLVWRWLC
jgi:hypothetical protein